MLRIAAVAALAAAPATADTQGQPAVVAAIGSVGTISAGLAPAIGTVQKHPGMLFNQTEPWEYNVNNGYPNVVFDPTDPHGTYRIWYRPTAHSCSVAMAPACVRSSVQ